MLSYNFSVLYKFVRISLGFINTPNKRNTVYKDEEKSIENLEPRSFITIGKQRKNKRWRLSILEDIAWYETCHLRYSSS